MYVPYELDKTRNLRYGMKALSAIEKRLGVSMSKLNLDDLTIEQVGIILLCGLEHEDNKLTLDKLMDLIDEHSNLQQAVEKLGEAFTAAFPQSKN